MACYDPAARISATTTMGDAMDSSAADPWVERAQAGETGAFEEIYRQHVGRVYALCLRMSGDPGEAAELVQDAFVRAWEKLDTFHGSSAFSSWLHRLTVNVVLGRWRARGRQRERVVAIDELTGDGCAGRDALQVPERRTTIDLERAIAALPTGARTVFVLHDVEGYGHKEIAEMTGLATGTCKAQLHRARRLLREALG